MGQAPRARLFYGLKFDHGEVPSLLRDMDDYEEIIDNVLGHTTGTYRERIEKRAPFVSAWLGERDKLILACFAVEQRTWGYRSFSVPTEAEVDADMHKLRAAAAAAGFPVDNKEFGWYLDADFR